jgi:hypothetical protein
MKSTKPTQYLKEYSAKQSGAEQPTAVFSKQDVDGGQQQPKTNIPFLTISEQELGEILTSVKNSLNGNVSAISNHTKNDELLDIEM